MKPCQAPNCINMIDQQRRSDSIYCSQACKKRAMRARKKARKSSNFLGLFGTGSESRESEGGHLADRTAADARFRQMLAADEATRVPNTVEREWAAYARRHGTIHPDEQAARTTRGKQMADDDWVQGTARFMHQPQTLAEQAQAARGRQRRPAPASGPLWDDDDPDLMEPPEMIDGGDAFQSGYRHAGYYR